MNQMDLEALAAAVRMIGSEGKRHQVCLIVGRAHDGGGMFFNWERWQRACDVATPDVAVPAHLEPGDGFVRFGSAAGAEYELLRSLADIVATIECAEERSEVCDRIGAVCAQANPFFDGESWASACQVRQPAEVAMAR